MEFKELIEARRSVRKYVASEITKAEIKAIMGIPDNEVVTSVIALGKAAGTAAKPPRKPVSEVVKVL